MIARPRRSHSRGSWQIAGCLLAAHLALASLAPPEKCRAAPRGGKLVIEAVDDETGQPVACRIHLKNPAGKPYLVKKLPHYHDHFVFDGRVALELPKGNYTFEIERGPEYAATSGHFVIEDHADDRHEVRLRRHVDMAGEGWWSGDLHIHRPVKHIDLLMRAEDLHVGPLLTWWNQVNAWDKAPLPATPVQQFDGNRYCDLLAGEDERGGGALLFFGLRRPLDLIGAEREYPSSLRYLLAAREQAGAWVDAEKPFWWDLPLWLALGPVDSIGLAHNHLCRDKGLDNEAWGKPRDKQRFRGPHACGAWSQEIYHHVLDCGLRIPPSAGSASGVLPNPVGYNRMYVFTGGQLDYDAWWQALREGRVLVSNGPLARPLVSGKLPGHVFQAPAGDTLELEINLKFATRDPARYIEVIRDGRVEHSVPLESLVQGGSMPRLSFDESGWFLIRAVADVDDTYRFCSTGAYYVEIGGQRRISRRSAQFFLDWTDERSADLETKLKDSRQREEVLAGWRQARAFWEAKVREANAD